MYRYNDKVEDHIERSLNYVLNNYRLIKYFDSKSLHDLDLLRAFASLTYNTGLDFTKSLYYKRVSNDENERHRYVAIKKKPTVTNIALSYNKKVINAFPQFPHTKILIIDIDQRSQSRYKTSTIVKKLKRDLGNPFYIERNSITEGYHLYYLFNKYISIKGKQFLENHYKDMKMNIEVIRGEKAIRFPYSGEYANDAYYFDNDQKIKVRGFKHLAKVFEEKDSKELSVPSFLMKNNIDDYETRELKKSRTPRLFDICKVQNTYDKFDYIPCKSEIEHDSNTVPSNITPNEDYTYGNGTRHIYQIKIGFHVLRQKGTFENFVTECNKWNDGTSKDMNSPNAEKVMFDVWSWCLNNFRNKVESEDYLDSDKYLCNKNFQLSKDEIQYLTQIFNYQYIVGNWGQVFTKRKDRFIEDAIQTYKILKQKSIYDYETDAKNTKYLHLSDLNDGISVSKKILHKISKTFKIKNISRIMKFLSYCNIIESIGIPDKKGNIFYYSYKKIRYSKHYKIRSVESVYKQMKDLFEYSEDNIEKLIRYLLMNKFNSIDSVKENFKKFQKLAKTIFLVLEFSINLNQYIDIINNSVVTNINNAKKFLQVYSTKQLTLQERLLFLKQSVLSKNQTFLSRAGP